MVVLTLSKTFKPGSNGLLSRAFERKLSYTIIDYHQLSRSLHVFKFDMIVDVNSLSLTLYSRSYVLRVIDLKN